MRSLLGGLVSLLAIGLVSQANAAEIVVPVLKDSSVIKSSYCCGNLEDKNFGDAATVDAGQYHHVSQALFAFDLSDLPSFEEILKVELVLPAPRVVGSSISSFRLGWSKQVWDELAVTWASKPKVEDLGLVEISSYVDAIIDLTSLLSWTDLDGLQEFTISLDSTGSGNLFVSSKESELDQAAYLLVTTTELAEDENF